MIKLAALTAHVQFAGRFPLPAGSRRARLSLAGNVFNQGCAETCDSGVAPFSRMAPSAGAKINGIYFEKLIIGAIQSFKTLRFM